MRIFQSKRGGPWHLDYRENGKRHRPEVGTKAEAEKALAQRKAERTLKRRSASGHLTNRVLLETVKDAWMKDCDIRCKTRTAASYRSCLEQILPKLPARYVGQLTPAMISRYATAMIAHGSRHTVQTKQKVKRLSSATSGTGQSTRTSGQSRRC